MKPAPEGTPGWSLAARETWAGIQEDLGLSADGWPGLKTAASVAGLIERDTQRPTTIEPPPEGFSFGSEVPGPRGISRDPKLLIPAFAAKVEILVRRLREQDFDPYLWEAYRTFERAQMLSDRGTGIIKSMHCYGAAVDFVGADDTPWEEPRAFWQTYRDEAESLGLHVLYRNGKVRDRPHVQAISVKDQHKFRAMSEPERREFVAQALA